MRRPRALDSSPLRGEGGGEGSGRVWRWAMWVLGTLALFAICATIAGLLMERRLKAYALLTAIGYTLSALGFLSLAWWAFARGHFRDVEAVKNKVLEAERT